MNTIELSEKEINMEIPSHWDEMDADQRGYCLKQALWASLDLITVDEAKIRCLYHLLGIERDWKSVMKERISSREAVMEKNSRIYLLAQQLITFLFKTTEKGSLEINYDTVYNHFPELTAGKTKLYGPAHLMADISFGEFRAAIECMNEYFENREEMALCRLIACMWRPERDGFEAAKRSDDFDGYRRQPFNRAKIEQNALAVKNVSTVTRTGILLWFTYTLQYIQSEDLILGGSQVNFSPLFPKAKKVDIETEDRRDRGYGWVSVLNSVSKEGPFGDTSKTEKVGLFDVLLYMLEMHDQNQKLKAKTKKR